MTAILFSNMPEVSRRPTFAFLAAALKASAHAPQRKSRLKWKIQHAERQLIDTIMEIILWDFLMFCQMFSSAQVKQSAIISNKQDVYELRHELPNDLRK